jgi:hypothetical protein
MPGDYSVKMLCPEIRRTKQYADDYGLFICRHNCPLAGRKQIPVSRLQF